MRDREHIRQTTAIARLLEGTDARGRAQRFLSRTGSVRGFLQAVARGAIRPPELTRSERTRLRAAVELVALALRPQPSAPLTSPTRVVAACPELWLKTHEEVWVIAVDAQLRKLVKLRIAIGSTHRSQLAISDVMRAAVGASATGMFVLHNHPGGGLAPSPEDIAFTKALRSSCEVVHVQLHDHLIVAGTSWVSCVTFQRGTWFHKGLAEVGQAGPWCPDDRETG